MKKAFVLVSLCAMGATVPAMAVEMAGSEQINVLVDKRFKVIDSNEDGKISKQEFMAASEKRNADGDTDHDGFLSKEELLAMKLKEVKDLSASDKK